MGKHRRAAAADAAVVGSGPNGLAAAIELARAGLAVRVYEGAAEIGGAARSAPLTAPGFLHDVGSAVHPLAAASPFLRQLPLDGLRWIRGPAALVHPFVEGGAAVLYRSIDETAAGLGGDAAAYRDLAAPLLEGWEALLSDPRRLLRRPWRWLSLANSGRRGIRRLLERRFAGREARALIAGIGAHANVTLDHAASSAVALTLLGAAHAVGWPIPEGGAGQITAAMARHLESLGGTIEVNRPIADVAELGDASPILLDCTPWQVMAMAGDRLPRRHRDRLSRFRYGPGVFKMDWALSSPIPWAAPECALSPTVHLGGAIEEIAASERAAWCGEHTERPFIILAQPTLFDPSRAKGGHIAWAYCHVPHGSARDRSQILEGEIERFAPGFRDTIVARRAWTPAALEAVNPNLIGGDIGGGALDGAQLLLRPLPSLDPWSAGGSGIYLCSSSTPPGPGVHGLCGWLAARSALRRL
jgi:phytoene dehydrogenase-like protein